MQHKLKQFIKQHSITSSNVLHLQYSRKYLFNQLRHLRVQHSNDSLRASLGLLRWQVTNFFKHRNTLFYRAACFLTGRRRGISKRFSVSRVCIKRLSSEGKLFGIKKSSW